MDVRRRLILKRVVLVMIMMFMSVAFGASNANLAGSAVIASQASQASQPTEPTAPIYSCFNCFALAYWQGYPFDGMSSNIDVRELHYCCNSANFISNKMYLTSHVSNHWMEIGYLALPAGIGGDNWYFWAEKRPYDNTRWEHLVGRANADWGTSANFYIERGTAPSTFNVMIDAVSNNYSDESTNNTIDPGWIDIGTELRGTSGAQMIGTTHWTSNMWKAPPGFNCGPHTPWCFQTANGNQAVTNPATLLGGWVKTPSHSSTGGDWATTCCNAVSDTRP